MFWLIIMIADYDYEELLAVLIERGKEVAARKSMKSEVTVT